IVSNLLVRTCPAVPCDVLGIEPQRIPDARCLGRSSCNMRRNSYRESCRTIVQESKTPLIGIFSGAMLLREPVQRYVLNVRASYDDETEELVKYLGDKLGNRKIAVLYQNDSFGLAGLGGPEKALGRRGLKLAAKGSFERNT